MAAQPVSPLRWRPMREEDIDGVVAVARAAFPGHFEARACFEERFALFAAGCSVLADPAAEEVKGYLVAYPWPLGAIPPLDSLLGVLPPEREAFYLHDLALHPEVRGQGHAGPAVRRLVEYLRASGGRDLALVSVNDTMAFWQRQGFAVVTADDVLRRKLASYGPDARYMRRAI